MYYLLLWPKSKRDLPHVFNHAFVTFLSKLLGQTIDKHTLGTCKLSRVAWIEEMFVFVDLFHDCKLSFFFQPLLVDAFFHFQKPDKAIFSTEVKTTMNSAPLCRGLRSLLTTQLFYFTTAKLYSDIILWLSLGDCRWLYLWGAFHNQPPLQTLVGFGSTLVGFRSRV